MPEDILHNYLQKNAYNSTVMTDMQTIPARYGVASFVPAGSTIKIVNTSGTQVIDTWAFALPEPPKSKEEAKGETPPPKTEETQKPTPKKTPKKGKGNTDLPSQEEAEAATAQGMQAKDEEAQKKSGWSSYIPSLPLTAAKTDNEKATVKQNSRTWGSYFNVGKGVTNYIPNRNSFSTFAKSHYRDPNKPIIQQISDFSKTPVGAAGVSALSGQGYASSLYAGYSAWTGAGQEMPASMEFLSLPHSRGATQHLVPKVGDTLVSNLRQPMLTVLEDTAATHDTLIAACDPARYEQLGVEGWEEHGSCAENLVLALKELNERAGLKAGKAIGAEVTVNSHPNPINLFMNIPVSDDGEIKFAKPKGKKGEYIRFKAERDVVVVMSACPQDQNDINGKEIQDGHFVVEEEEVDDGEDIRRRLQESSTNKKPAPVKKAAPKKINGTAPAAKKKTPPATAPAKPAASNGHAAIGTVKKPRTPIGTQKAVPSSTSNSASSKPAATPPSSSSRPSAAAPAAKARKDSSVSTIPSNTKHAGGAGSTAAPSSNATSVATERKKPRKIQRKAPAQAK